jgi:hypothetical protein
MAKERLYKRHVLFGSLQSKGIRAHYYAKIGPQKTMKAATEAALMSKTSKSVWIDRLDFPVSGTNPQQPWRFLDNNYLSEFAANFTGFLKVKRGGAYKFWVTASGGQELWVSGREIEFNEKATTGMKERQGYINLEPGAQPMTLRFFTRDPRPGLKVEWEGPDHKRTVLTSDDVGTTEPRSVASQFRNFDKPGWRAKFWAEVGMVNNCAEAMWNAKKLTPKDPTEFNANYRDIVVDEIHYSDENSPYWPGLSSNFEYRYAAQFTANLLITEPGLYTFFLESIDGAVLKIDDKVVCDNDGLHKRKIVEAQMELASGSPSIEVQYFDAHHGSLLKVGWKGPQTGFKKVLISGAGDTPAIGQLKETVKLRRLLSQAEVLGLDNDHADGTSVTDLGEAAGNPEAAAAAMEAKAEDKKQESRGTNVKNRRRADWQRDFNWGFPDDAKECECEEDENTHILASMKYHRRRRASMRRRHQGKNDPADKMALLKASRRLLQEPGMAEPGAAAGAPAEPAEPGMPEPAEPGAAAAPVEQAVVPKEESREGQCKCQLPKKKGGFKADFWSNVIGVSSMVKGIMKVHSKPPDLQKMVWGLQFKADGGFWDTDKLKLDANYMNNFVAAFEGFVPIEQDGAHNFFLTSTDGAELYVNNDLVVDNDGMHAMQTNSGAIELKAGELARIRIYFFKGLFPGPGLVLEWEPPEGKKTVLDGSKIWARPRETRGNSAENAPVLVRRRFVQKTPVELTAEELQTCGVKVGSGNTGAAGAPAAPPTTIAEMADGLEETKAEIKSLTAQKAEALERSVHHPIESARVKYAEIAESMKKKIEELEVTKTEQAQNLKAAKQAQGGDMEPDEIQKAAALRNATGGEAPAGEAPPEEPMEPAGPEQPTEEPQEPAELMLGESADMSNPDEAEGGTVIMEPQKALEITQKSREVGIKSKCASMVSEEKTFKDKSIGEQAKHLLQLKEEKAQAMTLKSGQCRSKIKIAENVELNPLSTDEDKTEAALAIKKCNGELADRSEASEKANLRESLIKKRMNAADARAEETAGKKQALDDMEVSAKAEAIKAEKVSVEELKKEEKVVKSNELGVKKGSVEKIAQLPSDCRPYHNSKFLAQTSDGKHIAVVVSPKGEVTTLNAKYRFVSLDGIMFTRTSVSANPTHIPPPVVVQPDDESDDSDGAVEPGTSAVGGTTLLQEGEDAGEDWVKLEKDGSKDGVYCDFQWATAWADRTHGTLAQCQARCVQLGNEKCKGFTYGTHSGEDSNCIVCANVDSLTKHGTTLATYVEPPPKPDEPEKEKEPTDAEKAATEKAEKKAKEEELKKANPPPLAWDEKKTKAEFNKLQEKYNDPDVWTLCSMENGLCKDKNKFKMKFGTDGKFRYKVSDGDTPCSTDVFGVIPGLSQQKKKCYKYTPHIARRRATGIFKDVALKGIKAEWWPNMGSMTSISQAYQKAENMPMSKSFNIKEVMYPETNGYWDRLDDRFTEYFFAKFTGVMMIKKTGKYKFYVTADDGAALYIDKQDVACSGTGCSGTLSMVNDGPKTKDCGAMETPDKVDECVAAKTVTGEANILKGTPKFELQYFNNQGDHWLNVQWSGEDFSMRPLNDEFIGQYEKQVEEGGDWELLPSSNQPTRSHPYTLSAQTEIRYGVDDDWVYEVFKPGSFTCNEGTFGDPDHPTPKTGKKCWKRLDSTGTHWRPCAIEGQMCKGYPGNHRIRFGAAPKYEYLETSGDTQCSTDMFGDPNPGVKKQCFVLEIPETAKPKTLSGGDDDALNMVPEGDKKPLDLARYTPDGRTRTHLGRATQVSTAPFGKLKGSGNAWNAVTGSIKGAFDINHCTHTYPTVNPWWRIILDEQSVIFSVKIYGRTDKVDNCQSKDGADGPCELDNINVYVSDQSYPGSGKACLEGPTHLDPKGTTVGCSKHAGRYVVIQKTGLGSLSLCGVKVMGLRLKDVPAPHGNRGIPTPAPAPQPLDPGFPVKLNDNWEPVAPDIDGEPRATYFKPNPETDEKLCVLGGRIQVPMEGTPDSPSTIGALPDECYPDTPHTFMNSNAVTGSADVTIHPSGKITASNYFHKYYWERDEISLNGIYYLSTKPIKERKEKKASNPEWESTLPTKPDGFTVKRYGPLCIVWGRVGGMPGDSVGTVPANCRPSQKVVLHASATKRNAWISIDTGGLVTLETAGPVTPTYAEPKAMTAALDPNAFNGIGWDNPLGVNASDIKPHPGYYPLTAAHGTDPPLTKKMSEVVGPPRQPGKAKERDWSSASAMGKSDSVQKTYEKQLKTVKNLNQDCEEKCEGERGRCPFCGEYGYCCMKDGKASPSTGCDGLTMGGAKSAQCTNPPKPSEGPAEEEEDMGNSMDFLNNMDTGAKRGSGMNFLGTVPPSWQSEKEGGMEGMHMHRGGKGMHGDLGEAPASMPNPNQISLSLAGIVYIVADHHVYTRKPRPNARSAAEAKELNEKSKAKVLEKGSDCDLPMLKNGAALEEIKMADSKINTVNNQLAQSKTMLATAHPNGVPHFEAAIEKNSKELVLLRNAKNETVHNERAIKSEHASCFKPPVPLSPEKFVAEMCSNWNGTRGDLKPDCCNAEGQCTPVQVSNLEATNHVRGQTLLKKKRKFDQLAFKGKNAQHFSDAYKAFKEIEEDMLDNEKLVHENAHKQQLIEVANKAFNPPPPAPAFKAPDLRHNATQATADSLAALQNTAPDETTFRSGLVVESLDVTLEDMR